MRMRKKPNLGPRMERCGDILIRQPEELRGRWISAFGEYAALHLEIGCGKGRFTTETAAQNPGILLAAVERVPDAMVLAMERAVAAELTNVRFADMDARKLADVFEPAEVDRIYLNFSDPWPPRRYQSRRLTSEGFLAVYKQILKPGGQIWFKTDNSPLFEFSVKEFERCGFTLSEVTRNLHENGECGVMTDYEIKFHEQGVPINRCVATYEV